MFLCHANTITSLEGNMYILKAVGAWVKTGRKMQGLSQESLGEKTGLSSNYISLIERGQKQVALTTLETISEALEIDLAALFENYVFKKKNPELEKELVALMELARTMNDEDIRVIRKMLGHFHKKKTEEKR